ncbi:hypothetical protein SASPL_134882 [Salvia splendens]|uniref:Polygalacturonase n=1 Tax=Salvia splendens TaxID=180675 RepID=A0A8X8WYK3_SALSN|nr:hypothetical protein SASPL_134882 [Salvia splendens]
MNVMEVTVVVVMVLMISASGEGRVAAPIEYSAISCRGHTASILEFGGVGDGKTLNTAAFQRAVNELSKYASDGGAQLFVPAGEWLTGSFNLTSHFTLYLHKHAILLASQDIKSWGVVDPLPSYGLGRDAAGGRYISLTFGTNLTDVVITGENGTIDGEGGVWWQQFHKKKLKYTRPYLIEIMHSHKIQISNLTFLNSPSWNLHPVYSSDIIIKGITILAPVTSPNTDGINPVKSGWDEYGIKYGMPTKQLTIRRLTCVSPYSAAIALGSEMSGEIEDVRAEDIKAVNTESVFWMTGNYGSHADIHYDPNALPEIKGFNYRDVVEENVTMAARLEGISGDPFTGICMSNVTIGMAKKAKKYPWTCSEIKGITSRVVPQPCSLLPDKGRDKRVMCDFPTDTLPIDDLKLQKCSYVKNYL